MKKKKKKNTQMIDMSGRLQIKIIKADEDELERNRLEFDALNNSIEEKIKKSNERVDQYVEALLAEETDEVIDVTSLLNYYSNIYQNRNPDNVKETKERLRMLLLNK